MSPNELVTKKDLEIFQMEVIKSITEMLKTNNQTLQAKTWVKVKDACEMMSCCKNQLEKFAIHGKIIRKKKVGAWYYSVKSINDYLNSRSDVA